jgi:hypothetical protein
MLFTEPMLPVKHEFRLNMRSLVGLRVLSLDSACLPKLKIVSQQPHWHKFCYVGNITAWQLPKSLGLMVSAC